jgi:hypothetical protein
LSDIPRSLLLTLCAGSDPTIGTRFGGLDTASKVLTAAARRLGGSAARRLGGSAASLRYDVRRMTDPMPFASFFPEIKGALEAVFIGLLVLLAGAVGLFALFVFAQQFRNPGRRDRSGS